MALYPNPRAASRTLFVTAPLFVTLLLSGCQKKSEPPKPAAPAARETAQSTPAPAPEANIYVDEAMLASPFAIIGGTVQNVGAQRLEQLSVQIELRRRADGGVERREVSVEPAVLEPGRQGKYKLKVRSEEWSGSRVVGLKSGARAGEVAFKSLPGAKRPPEKMTNKTVTAAGPPARKRADGDEFINTPDTPYRVP